MKKKLFIVLLSIMLVYSCKTSKDFTLPKSEMDKFSTSGDTICYEGNPVAVYVSMEWEYYNGEKILEISFDRINGGMDNMCDIIVNYIHTRWPKSKVEVKVFGNWSSE